MKILSGKRGQAALEYLTTYGWALLIIVVMVGALVGFGVFSPNKTNSCIASTGLVCVDSQMSVSGNTIMAVTNGLGDISSVTVSSSKNLNTGVDAGCSLFSDVGLTTPIGASDVVSSGQRIYIRCAAPVSPNVQQGYEVVLSYMPQNGVFVHTGKVTLSGTSIA